MYIDEWNKRTTCTARLGIGGFGLAGLFNKNLIQLYYTIIAF